MEYQPSSRDVKRKMICGSFVPEASENSASSLKRGVEGNVHRHLPACTSALLAVIVTLSAPSKKSQVCPFPRADFQLGIAIFSTLFVMYWCFSCGSPALDITVKPGANRLALPSFALTSTAPSESRRTKYSSFFSVGCDVCASATLTETDSQNINKYPATIRRL